MSRTVTDVLRWKWLLAQASSYLTAQRRSSTRRTWGARVEEYRRRLEGDETYMADTWTITEDGEEVIPLETTREDDGTVRTSKIAEIEQASRSLEALVRTIEAEEKNRRE